MQILAATDTLATGDGALVVVAATTSDDGPVVHGEVDALGLDLAAALTTVEFDGSKDATARVPLPDGGSVLVVGCGDEVSRAAVRDLGAAAGRAGSKRDDVDVVLPPTADAAEATQALAEGLVLGSYKFLAHRSDADPVQLETVRVHGDVDADALTVGQVLGLSLIHI